mmetsp:Transcript_22867/g.64754  ORF Transcript_22867/g.64754 Transcript_22867/m.64754 type:complete len:134 (+) Transcript_22867:1-402(+)
MGAYGSEVGSASIKFIPTGGMYVTGGLTPKNIKFIKGENSPFMKAYRDKGRVAPLLNTVPLFAVLVEDLGVRGAHKAAIMAYERHKKGKSPAGTTQTTKNAPKEGGAENTKYMHMVTAFAVGALCTALLARRK